MVKDNDKKPDPLQAPHLQSGYTGDEERGEVEAGPPVRTESLRADENRGRRAPVAGSGVVIGSGAGAGGGGGAEDFDSDAQGGGGHPLAPEDDHPRTKADAPVGGSR